MQIRKLRLLRLHRLLHRLQKRNSIVSIIQIARLKYFDLSRVFVCHHFSSSAKDNKKTDRIFLTGKVVGCIVFTHKISSGSAVWLAHLVWDQRVGGSNPFRSTFLFVAELECFFPTRRMKSLLQMPYLPARFLSVLRESRSYGWKMRVKRRIKKARKRWVKGYNNILQSLEWH